MNENGYVNYQAMVSKVSTSAENVKNICGKLNLQEQVDTLEDVEKRLQSHVFRVGIMGEFKRGKSTVINALLGQSIVPADILPCSATLNRIVWDARPHAQINFKKDENGYTPASKDVPVEELSSYVTKLTKESEKRAGNVEDAVVYYPCKFCQDGVEIIDTPGLNDDERMDQVSEMVIPTLDAIIMVIAPDSPFSISEANFVRNKILTSDLGRLIFVVNKIDMVREKDREKFINGEMGIRSKINSTILQKTESMYGRDSQEYRSVEAKLGGIRIYPLSAANALDGKVEGEQELLAKSGMPEFEEALSKLLTEERGLLELVPAVGVTLSKLKEADEAIVMRTNAMNMEQEEFEKMQDEAMRKIRQSREETKNKAKEIKGIAASIYQELQPDVLTAYNQLEESLTGYIDAYKFSAEDFKNQEAVNRLLEKMSSDIDGLFEMGLQESTEKMQVKIQDRLGQEAEGLQVYGQQLSANIDEIRCMIPQKTGAGNGTEKIDTIDKLAMGVEVFTNFTPILPGLGGAISGFKDHGALGGIVGFGTGFAATSLAAYAGGFVAGFLLGPSAMVAMAPILIISGVVGSFGGKKITNFLFDRFGKPTEKKPEELPPLTENELISIRNSLKKEIQKNVNNLRLDRTLENWLKGVADETFNALSDKLEEETEEALSALQETLTNIQVDLSKSKAHKEAVLENLNSCHQDLIRITETIAPVKARLDAFLVQNS